MSYDVETMCGVGRAKRQPSLKICIKTKTTIQATNNVGVATVESGVELVFKEWKIAADYNSAFLHFQAEVFKQLQSKVQTKVFLQNYTDQTGPVESSWYEAVVEAVVRAVTKHNETILNDAYLLYANGNLWTKRYYHTLKASYHNFISPRSLFLAHLAIVG